MSRPRTVSMERVLELYRQGLSQVAIGRELNIHRTSVYYFLKLAGVKRPDPEATRAARIVRLAAKTREREVKRQEAFSRKVEMAHEMSRMYMEQGVSSHKIADHFGCSARHVVRILRRNPDVAIRWPRVCIPRSARMPKFSKPPVSSKESTFAIERMMILSSRRSV